MYLKTSIQNINSIKNLNKIDSTAILILQNGKFFKGLGLGYQGTATGEVCFNTSITGYQEIISDPSYAEQIMVKNNECFQCVFYVSSINSKHGAALPYFLHLESYQCIFQLIVSILL